MEALELRLRESEVDSERVLGDQVEANRLLRQQLDDLQTRLDEKEKQLFEANEIIRALRDEVQTLHQQLEHQTPHQQLEHQTPHQQLEHQTPHQQLEQQTPHQQLEHQTPHQQLEHQTPHQQLEHQTPHQQLEHQTPHQQLEHQTPHQQLEQQRRLKLTHPSTAALSAPRRRAPHRSVTFRVCLLPDPHINVSRQKGKVFRKIKVPLDLSAKEFQDVIRGAFPKLGNIDFQFAKVDVLKRIKALQVSPVTPSVLKTSGELRRSALYILPKNEREACTTPSALECAPGLTDVGNGNSHDTVDTADADDQTEDTERSPQRKQNKQDVTSQSPQLRLPLETNKDQDITSQTLQTPQLRPPLETNCALKTSVYVSPVNLLLICTSEDDPEDRTVSLSDVAERPSQQVPLRMVSVNLEDCRGMLGPDGVYKIQTENEDHSDEGSSDYDQHDGNDDDDGDSLYDPNSKYRW
ncbi:probable basic-leucine zipper transcription factor Q isoform X2 [Sardina pilchardus]|uniref:probable basic-leucine zipper transcription factor Q isoform X2 n=1 Tax=Sardina pilchardus TaxID=27697 RepID=UPI002E1352EC